MPDGVGAKPPRVGQPFPVQLTNISSKLFVRVFGIVGVSKSVWGTNPLPLDLKVIGMPGCRLFVSMDFLVSLTHSAGTSTWTLQIPNIPSLAGGRFFIQGLVFEPGSNAVGAILSNAGEGKIGL